jgi:hypothetical protein
VYGEITLIVDEAEIKRRLGLLADQSNKVIMRAANRAYPTGKKAISQEAAKDYRVTQRDVNSQKTLKIIKATQQAPTASLNYTGEHRNLYLWDNNRATAPKTIIHWSHGKPNVKIYRAAVMKGHQRIRLKGDKKPFVQKVQSGKKSEFVGLFRRRTADRDADLVGVGAPAVPQILKNDKIIAHFNEAAGAMMQKRLEHEIDNVLKGITK